MHQLLSLARAIAEGPLTVLSIRCLRDGIVLVAERSNERWVLFFKDQEAISDHGSYVNFNHVLGLVTGDQVTFAYVECFSDPDEIFDLHRRDMGRFLKLSSVSSNGRKLKMASAL